MRPPPLASLPSWIRFRTRPSTWHLGLSNPLLFPASRCKRICETCSPRRLSQALLGGLPRSHLHCLCPRALVRAPRFSNSTSPGRPHGRSPPRLKFASPSPPPRRPPVSHLSCAAGPWNICNGMHSPSQYLRTDQSRPQWSAVPPCSRTLKCLSPSR